MALAFETFVPLPRRQTMTFEKRRTAFVHERVNDTFKRCRLHGDDYNTRGVRTVLAIAYSPRGIYLISPSAAAYSLKNRVLFLPSSFMLVRCISHFRLGIFPKAAVTSAVFDDVRSDFRATRNSFVVLCRSIDLPRDDFSCPVRFTSYDGDCIACSRTN